MNEREQQAERPHELHDFGETPQIVFLLHDFPDWRFLYERENLAEYVAMAVRGHVWPGVICTIESPLFDRQPHKKIPDTVVCVGNVIRWKLFSCIDGCSEPDYANMYSDTFTMFSHGLCKKNGLFIVKLPNPTIFFRWSIERSTYGPCPVHCPLWCQDPQQSESPRFAY